MTRLSSALGANYESKRNDMRIRTFELGGHRFKVRVPLVSESDGMYLRVMNPDAARVEEVYKETTESLQKFKDQASDDFQFTDNDILVSGRSMREAAKSKAMTEARITEYVRLLVAENPENTLNDITYADIEAEWPLAVQLTLTDKIGEVISPTYKETRGN